jgi:hypothetical protein
MHRILGLGALGLFVLAGSSFAQQPASGSGASSAPVVQSSGSYAPTYSNRRFGLFRGNSSGRFFRRNNTVNTTSQARVETAPPPAQTNAEQIKVMPTEKTTAKGEMKSTAKETDVTTTTPVTYEPSTTTSNRRFLRRDGGLLSRLGSRFGR